MQYKVKIGTDCSGIGSPEQALKELGFDHEIVFACEKDKYAIKTYLANHSPMKMFNDMTTRDNTAIDLYADIYIAGIPCQSFSLAGKRLGESDARGTLFYNFYDYVKNQNPKYFVIENVKGLLSDKKGRTFRSWLELLSLTINKQEQLHIHPDSLLYNVHHTVLNSKNFGVPQNRERVFIIGIRNDLPNDFIFPNGEPLKIKLKDVLQKEVSEKYYLSDKFLKHLIKNINRTRIVDSDCACKGTIMSNQAKQGTDSIYLATNNKGNLNEIEISTCLDANYHKGVDNHAARSVVVYIKEATSIGYSEAIEGDSINIQMPNSTTRRGRVGHQIANTIDTACNQAVIQLNESRESGNNQPYQQNRRYDSVGMAPALLREKSDLLILNNLKIRRLTPLECFRLQGFPDAFIKPVSETQQYKQAGNTITVTVLKAIFKNLLK